MITARAVDKHVEQLFDVLRRLHSALTRAEIPYRVIGGLGVFLQVSAKDPLAARLTRDVDVAIDRKDLKRIAEAVQRHGFRYRHDARGDLLVDATQPKARSAVHFVFVREKVRPDYLEAVPDFSKPTVTEEGILLASVADLIRMKLTSLRLKDKVHLMDMDSVGLITSEIGAELPEILRGRLDAVPKEEAQPGSVE